MLAELLLALSLIIVMLVLVAGIFPYSYTVDQKAWRKNTAHRLVESTLERIRAQEFEDIDDFVDALQNEPAPKIDDLEYELTVTVTDTTAPPVKSKTVVCVATWTTPQGRESYRQETRISEILHPE